MDKIQAFNLLVEVISRRANGTMVEMDSWKEAILVLKRELEPKPEAKEEKQDGMQG